MLITFCSSNDNLSLTGREQKKKKFEACLKHSSVSCGVPKPQSDTILTVLKNRMTCSAFSRY